MAAAALAPRSTPAAGSPGRARVAPGRPPQPLGDVSDPVFLSLLLGEPEQFALPAVAEAQVVLVVDAVAAAPELPPQLGHGAQLRVLLDEPDPRVHEERDP